MCRELYCLETAHELVLSLKKQILSISLSKDTKTIWEKRIGSIETQWLLHWGNNYENKENEAYQKKVTLVRPLVPNLSLCPSSCAYDHDACDDGDFFFHPGAHELQ